MVFKELEFIIVIETAAVRMLSVSAQLNNLCALAPRMLMSSVVSIKLTIFILLVKELTFQPLMPESLSIILIIKSIGAKVLSWDTKLVTATVSNLNSVITTHSLCAPTYKVVYPSLYFA